MSPVYRSPDIGKLVLAYVTSIVVKNEVLAVLHYEHGLDVYQGALNKGLSGCRRLDAGVLLWAALSQRARFSGFSGHHDGKAVECRERAA